MKVILTDAAEADLEAIGDWIERDNPERALTFTR
jgi:plasmid stabilization system protein ParE